MAGDYLIYNGRTSHLSEGSWTIFRVYDKPQKNLRPLEGTRGILPNKPVCASDAPVKNFSVVAIDKALKFNPNTEDMIEVDFERKLLLSNPNGKVFVLENEVSKVADDKVMPHPLTLHVNIGDCVKVKLTNRLKKGKTSLHVNNMAFDPKDSQGINVGYNKGDQTVKPGASKTYTFFAHPGFKINGGLIWDFGDLVTNVRDGLYRWHHHRAARFGVP